MTAVLRPSVRPCVFAQRWRQVSQTPRNIYDPFLQKLRSILPSRLDRPINTINFPGRDYPFSFLLFLSIDRVESYDQFLLLLLLTLFFLLLLLLPGPADDCSGVSFSCFVYTHTRWIWIFVLPFFIDPIDHQPRGESVHQNGANI